MYILFSKLKNYRHKLVEWQHTNHNNSARLIVELNQKLEAEKQKGQVVDKRLILKLEDDLQDAYEKEERYWKEKSHVKWLQWGDQNTKFFHAKFHARNRQNKLEKLKDENGLYRTDAKGIGEVAESFFKKLFSTSNPKNPEDALEGLERKVDDRMNRILTRSITEEEVKKAIFSVNPFSALGEDGFTARFFQFYWEVVKDDIFQACASFFSGGKMLRSLNHTQICLISKITCVDSMTHIRPISLSTVFYKVISKLLVHRMQFCMDKIISMNQSAFIKGRLISDNILIAHEFMHYLKNKRHGNFDMALKLDMSKSYDRVEWSFVWKMLKRMGFYQKWIGWMQECVTTVFYSVLVDGFSYGFFKPTRGLRQRDPISPYLFFICAEVFFSQNTPEELRNEIVEILRVPHVGSQDKYLGLPAVVNRSKNTTYSYIEDKVSKKLNQWKRSLLSASAREVLIKAVGSAMPIYTLSCFKLPESLIDNIQRKMMQFWWGQRRNERKLQWIKWDTVRRNKDQEGLGFKDLKAFNLAMLEKQSWRILKKTDSLLHRVYKAKYFSYSPFMNAQIGQNPSWAWRSILEGRNVLEKGLNWQIGQDTVAQNILQTPRTGEQDKLIWGKEKNGSYSVNTGYQISFQFFHPAQEYLPEIFHQKELWRSIWGLRCPAKVGLFLWKAVHVGLEYEEHGFMQQWYSKEMSRCKPAITLWQIWIARNLKVFEDKNSSSLEIAQAAIRAKDEFYRATFC
ncbi:uncharacterized protein LOC107633966 [Arachis ipaensis]|uniref:uncharacterized protein LOC107633966 n=1 Tax=Arachis ipaensis TaxID=130454 RepID=UPI0007AFC74C|nr:uncharacterized protein LOC107633966 [Arachis ipaensis]